MPRLAALLTALFCLALAAPAQAGWFRSVAVDGPGEIDALGDVDMARDGTGGIVYIKREAGVPQVFLSRIRNGGFARPERLSAGAAVSEAAVTAVDRGRLVVAWIAGGEVVATQLKGRGRPAAPTVLGGGGASGLAVDMGVNEAAYAIWSAAGDVRAARYQGGWTPIPAPLDIDPARAAGGGALRPRVAVSAEGNAVGVWGEDGGDGRTHVFSRRLTGTTLSSFPQDLTLPDFEGGAGGSADSPDIDIEDDGSFAWVAFRQDIGGRSRSIARRLLGSTYEPPAAIDAGQTSGAPRLDFTGRGLGASVAQAGDNAVFSSYLDVFDRFNRAVRLDTAQSAAAPGPVVAASERNDTFVAWRAGTADGGGSVIARRKEGSRPFERPFTASSPNFGAPLPGHLAISADLGGNASVAMLQGGPGASRLAVAVYDRPPTRSGRPALDGAEAPAPAAQVDAGLRALGPAAVHALRRRPQGGDDAAHADAGPPQAPARAAPVLRHGDGPPRPGHARPQRHVPGPRLRP